MKSKTNIWVIVGVSKFTLRSGIDSMSTPIKGDEIDDHDDRVPN